MPYVNVPNDLSKIKTKMAFNLTKRQLICFGGAAAIGIPSYLLAREPLGNSGAMFLMLAVMLPAFLLAMYEKDGLPFEKVVHNICLLYTSTQSALCESASCPSGTVFRPTDGRKSDPHTVGKATL